MNNEELSAFVSAIRENRLLEGADFNQLENLVSRCQEPTELARELMERGSLTRYQTELLFQGEGKRLVLGQYILLEPIGEGGMGQVFKAKHSRMKRVVALKIIRKDVAAGSMALQRFTQEIEAAAQLTHPNVVLAYDANEVDNILFFVMEFVEGIDLGKLVQRFGKPPLGNACDYICQAARGLKHAHEKGLIHRDIKPSNLLLSFADSTVKILDMGLARLREKADDPARHLTFTGMVMGTPDFISPEQAKDSRLADHRSDLYSLGCTFYYLLAGRVPFHEGSFTEKLLKHSLEEPTPIEELCPELPREVATIVKHLMVKRPDDRYQTATELIKDLEPFATPAKSAEQFRPPKEAESEAPVRRPLVSQTDVTLQRPGEDLGRKALQPHFDTGTAALPQPRQAADNSKWATLPVTKMPGTDGSSASSVPVATNKPPRSSVGHGLGAIAAGLGLALLAFVGWKAATGGFGSGVAVVTPPTIRDTTNSKTTETSPKVVTPPDTRAKPPDTGKVQPPETKKEPVEKKVVLPTGRIVDIPKKDLRAKDFPMRAAFSPGGRWLAAGWNDTLRIWDLDVAKPGNADFVQPDFPLSAVSIADDGRVLLGTTEEIRQKGKVPRPVPVLALWEPKGLDLPVTIGRHDGEVSCLAFSSQGNRAISGSDDRTVRLWELRTSKELKLLRKHDSRVNAVAISPDGRRALSGGRDNKVILWDLEAGTDLQTFTGHDSFVTCVAFSPDGKYAVSGGYDRKLILWDLEKREKVRVYTDHTRTITSVAFTPDGKRFVSGSDDLRLYVWSIHAPEFLAMFDDHRLPIIAVGVSADGRYALSVGDDHTVRRWVLPPANP